MPDQLSLAFRRASSTRISHRQRQQGTSTGDLNHLIVGGTDIHREEDGTSSPVDDVPTPSEDTGDQRAPSPRTNAATQTPSSGPHSPAKGKAVYMRRHANLLHCVCFIVGSTIGPNVFLSPSVFIADTNSAWTASVVILVCGVLCTVAALCYADLITAFKQSGGEVIYFFRCFGERPAHVQVWMALLVGRTGGAAVSAMNFASLLVLPLYPTSYLDNPMTLIRMVAVITLLALFYVNCVSVPWTLRLQVLFTAVKVAALLFVMVGALVTLCRGQTAVVQHSLSYRADFRFSKLAAAIFNVINLFTGWYVLAFIAEDIKDVNRTVPLAMLISVPLITAIYALLNLSFLVVLTPEEILANPAISTVFAKRLLGDAGSWLMPVMVAISTLSAFNGMVMGSGRLLMVASRLRCGHELWSMLSVSRNTPVAAFLTFLPVSLIMVNISGIAWILQQLASFKWISVGASCLVLLMWKKKVPDIGRPYQVPTAFPAIFLLTSLILIGYSVYRNPVAVVITMTVAVSVVPLKKLGEKLLEKKPQLVQAGAKMTIFLQKLLLVVHQEIPTF